MNGNETPGQAAYRDLLEQFKRCDSVPMSVVGPILRHAGKSEADLRRDLDRQRARSGSDGRHGMPPLRTR